ncbi:MAG TPA: hypothetical protein VJ508_20130, partial [Saprospiraceae bacterium]|nr:hypothetical protein [Saprospiraceae bacterium]
MKTNNLLWILTGISLIAAFYAIWESHHVHEHLENLECAYARSQCESACNEAFGRDTLAIAITRSNAILSHDRALLACRIDHIGNQAAIDECTQNENARFNRQMNGLEAQLTAIRDQHTTCLDTCAAHAAECEEGDEDEGSFTPSLDEPFEINCIEGNNALCFKEVPEICKMIQDVCQDCLTSLCPGSDWMFSADGNVEISLVAAPSEKDQGRTLCKSSMKEKMIVLEVPEKVKLESGEKLYLRFIGEGAKAG